MSIVYAIANQKGGVGKTTTAVNVAACIAEAGYETLLVDVDPQGNATVGVGADRQEGVGLYDVLSGDVPARRTRSARPASSACRCSPPRPTSPARRWSCRACPAPSGDCATRSRPCATRYAYTLLDCPPSLGPLTVNALVAADRVIVPVQTEYFALEGLAGLLDTLALIQRELNPRLTVAGMLLTMHDAAHQARAGRGGGGPAAFPVAGLRHRHPAQRAARRGAELRPARHPPRSALRRIRRLLRTRQGGGRAWLSAAEAWAAASRRSCRRRPRGRGAGAPRRCPSS